MFSLEGEWSRDRRRQHILLRLGYVRTLLPRLGLETVSLRRGIAARGELDADRSRTFVSTSFSEVVARSLADAGDDAATTRLVKRDIPADRIFMSYLETRAMNDRYLEAEAVLLADREDDWV